MATALAPGTTVISATTGGLTANTNLTVHASNAATFKLVSGTNQNTLINAAFSQPLVAQLTDAQGNGVAGASVTFAAPSNNGAGVPSAVFSNSTTPNLVVVTTDESGYVTAPVAIANNLAGSYNVTAIVAGLPSLSYSLTNTLAATSYIYYLPFLANQAGGFTSYLAFQNNTATAATVQLQYYTEQGVSIASPATTCGSVAGNAECIPPNPFAVGVRGTGVLISTQPLNVVVAEATPAGGSAYAVKAGAASSLVVPVALNGAFGGFTSQISVANFGPTTVTATVSFYDNNGNVQTSAAKTLTIAPYTSSVLDQSSTSSNLASGFSGWAKVSSPAGSQLVAQVVEQNSSNHFVAIAGATASGQTTVYAPTAFRGAYGSFATGAAIVNPNSPAVQVTVTYYDQNGTATTTPSFNLPAYGVASVYQGANSGNGIPTGGLPNGYTGAMQVNASGGGVVMLVNEAGTSTPGGTAQSGSYLATSSGGNRVGLPVVANGGFGYITGATIYNTSNAAVSGTISFYNSDGSPTGVSQSFSVAAHASVAYYQGSANLALGYYGTAIVSETGSGNDLIVTTNAESFNFFYTYTEPNS